MLNISLANKTDKSVNEQKIIDAVKKTFAEHGFSENIEASIAIVHHSEVVRLAVLYMKETEEEAQEHPVLSFLTSEIEHEFVYPPDGINHLGEVVVSYDEVEENMVHWAEHGALHLMGIHHD